MLLKGYAGSYATRHSQYLLQFTFDEDTHQFISHEEIMKWPDAKYLSLYHNLLAAPIHEEQAGIQMLHLKTKQHWQLLSEEKTSCCMQQDENFIYTANYHEGTLSIYEKTPQLTLYKRIVIQEKAGSHQIILQGDYVLVPCLLLDAIYVFNKRKAFALSHILPFPKGSGPRHGVFDAQGNLYIVSELSNQLFLLRLDETMHGVITHVCELKETAQQKAAAAAIRLDKQERYLYITLRECNQLLVYDIRKQQITQRLYSGGDHPRDMILSPSEKHVFVIHRFSNSICVFQRNEENGMLSALPAMLEVVEGVCILFEQEEI